MTASFISKRTLSSEAGSVYAWSTVEGDIGNILINPEGSVARPCTSEGEALGRMRLDKNRESMENPDADPRVRNAFMVVAVAILREAERQGRLPDKVTRTYW
ncbi:hypothetical protein [Streptomyces sp. B3I8]|uniref:hypothetical protein n=1 Tax=Streptomyces sp. B3I8 TaxID=3042303 RepID=UPI0027D92F75|nr:hypothetical protein [Streptomyces sp. B3I8]